MGLGTPGLQFDLLCKRMGSGMIAGVAAKLVYSMLKISAGDLALSAICEEPARPQKQM